jgi:hypothetical protein
MTGQPFSTILFFSISLAAWLNAGSCKAPEAQDRSAAELILDSRFQSGFAVLDPKSGKRIVRGEIRSGSSEEEIVWDLAQWSSRYTLADATSESLPAGGVRFSDRSKTVVFATSGPERADLVLGIDTRQEWGETARKEGDPWPHLLVQQKFSETCPRLTDLKELRFRVETCLSRARRVETPEYNPSVHAAQFLIYFTVQNGNPDSSGHGDFLWLGVPVYDDRGSLAKTVIEGDVGLGKLIYNPARSSYAEEEVAVGQWITYEADLLPHAFEGFREAWARGFLKGSEDPSDYAISSMNMGWEVPGIHDVEMQVRGLSLLVVR